MSAGKNETEGIYEQRVGGLQQAWMKSEMYTKLWTKKP